MVGIIFYIVGHTECTELQDVYMTSHKCQVYRRRKNRHRTKTVVPAHWCGHVIALISGGWLLEAPLRLDWVWSWLPVQDTLLPTAEHPSGREQIWLRISRGLGRPPSSDNGMFYWYVIKHFYRKTPLVGYHCSANSEGGHHMYPSPDLLSVGSSCSLTAVNIVNYQHY